ncbi:MAG TPA: fatty acid desaturase, partial [Pirellulales bacterium]
MNQSTAFATITAERLAPTSSGNDRQTARQSPAFVHLKFGSDDAFYREICRRVDGYFEQTGINRRDCPRMYLKTAIVLTGFASSYVLLVFIASTWWQAVPLAISLALSMAAIGFNIQHDGAHGAYSNRSWINKLMALTLDLLGGSSYGWACKHNIVHHTYSNITGHDDDIEIGILGRLTPHQKHFSFHRWQHIYLWLLYGFVAIKWQLYDDFRDVINGRFGGYRHPRPKGWELAIFIGGKALFFSLALGVPLFQHSVWTVLAFYLAVSFMQGIVLSLVFQLPHCTESAAFPMPQAESGRMETPWAVHQVQTTVNYGRGNQ